MTFNEWCVKHANIFGMLNDPEAIMIHEWAGFLEGSGYSADECFAASRWLAENDPPRFRGDHYPALVKRIGRARLAVALENREQEQRLAEANNRDQECANCFNTGYAKVPHLVCVLEGQWFHPFYCLDVICDCQRGRAIEAVEPQRILQRAKTSPQSPKQKAQMTLSEYRVKNPDWRVQLKDRAEAARREAAGTRRAGMLDQAMGEIEKRLAAKWPAWSDEARKT